MDEISPCGVSGLEQGSMGPVLWPRLCAGHRGGLWPRLLRRDRQLDHHLLELGPWGTGSGSGGLGLC